MAVAVMLPATPSKLPAAEHWISLKTPHFEMYTTNSEKQGTAALRVFEQVRYFFLQNSPAKSTPDAPVRIIAFRSEKEYRPYRLNEGAFAYYLRSRKTDYIVMQDVSSEHYQAAVHEYTHLIIEHLGLKLPIWLNEGLADLYSSLEARGDQAIVGRPLVGRTGALETQKWLDLNVLFAVNQESPYYNESDKMSIFYAQSWALTHMLELGKGYRPGFQKFLAAISSGKPEAQCFQTIYGKNFAQITQDLHAYLHQSSVQAAVFDVRLGKPDLQPVVSEASGFDIDLSLADLLASKKRTAGEAFARLSQLAKEHPERPEVQESLGYLAWQQGNAAQARRDFQSAAEKGSKDPEMLFYYSQLMADQAAPPVEIIPVLQKVVELKRDNLDAWFNLGMTAMDAKQWSLARGALSEIKTVKRERAYSLFSALAFCDLELKDTKGARAMADKARLYAENPEQTTQISNMLRYLDSAEQRERAEGTSAASLFERPDAASSDARSGHAAAAPGSADGTEPARARDVPSIRWTGNLAHVEGMVTSFECTAKGPRLHVLVGSKAMVLAITDPKQIVVRNAKEGFFDIHCGPQKPFHVGIFYVPADHSKGTNGEIRELVF